LTTESASLTARLFSFQGKGRGGHKVSQFLNMKKQRTANTSMLLPERGRPVRTVACDRKGSSTSGPPILRCSCRSADGPSARSLATEKAHPPVDRQYFDALAGARTARPHGRLRPKRLIHQWTANPSMLLPERGRPVRSVACDRKGPSNEDTEFFPLQFSIPNSRSSITNRLDLRIAGLQKIL